MKKLLMGICVGMLLAGIITTGALAGGVNVKLGPWESLYAWQGQVVNVQLNSNIVLLRSVRLLSVQDDGLLIKNEKGLNLQERNQERFIPYDRILSVDLVK